METKFDTFEIKHIPLEDNSWADHLEKLIITKNPDLNKIVVLETLEVPSTKVGEGQLIMIGTKFSCISPIINYLTMEKLPKYELKARNIRLISSIYVIVVEKPYKIGGGLC